MLKSTFPHSTLFAVHSSTLMWFTHVLVRYGIDSRRIIYVPIRLWWRENKLSRWVKGNPIRIAISAWIMQQKERSEGADDWLPFLEIKLCMFWEILSTKYANKLLITPSPSHLRCHSFCIFFLWRSSLSLTNEKKHIILLDSRDNDDDVKLTWNYTFVEQKESCLER